MGIFFNRRAERSNCTPTPVECEQNVSVTEDPRKQYMEMHNQCTDATDRHLVSPKQFAPPGPAPGPYIPSEGFGGTTSKENSPRIGDNGLGITEGGSRPRPSHLPPLTLTELPQPRDVFRYGGDGTTQSPRWREVPPPPLPATDLPPVPIRRDLFQYGDGKGQAPPVREVPSSTPMSREYRVQPEPFHQDGCDHPGPGSRRRRSLREQLGLPERHQPFRREAREGAIENPMPVPVPVPHRERLAQERQEHQEDRREHRLDARLERIREKLAKLTHISTREKEQAFSPTSDEQRTLQLINNERRRYRLPDVVQDPRLQVIASRHTEYQCRNAIMTHSEKTPGWQTVPQRMKQVGLDGWRENAASGSFTPEVLVRMWMNSPGHKAAILGQGNIAAVSIRNGKATFNLTTDPELQRQG
ncbi:hypothetical protein BH10CYA1_BH10CYA1_47500 [soil metagenome]